MEAPAATVNAAMRREVRLMKISYHDFSKKTGIRSTFHASFNQIYTVVKPDCSNNFGMIMHDQEDV
jgi:hypothetical protein